MSSRLTINDCWVAFKEFRKRNDAGCIFQMKHTPNGNTYEARRIGKFVGPICGSCFAVESGHLHVRSYVKRINLFIIHPIRHGVLCKRRYSRYDNGHNIFLPRTNYLPLFERRLAERKSLPLRALRVATVLTWIVSTNRALEPKTR